LIVSWFDNINKVPLSGPGVMTGSQAVSLAGRSHRGGPALCQDCFQRPGRVQITVNGKRTKVCHGCAPAPEGTAKTKKSGRRKTKKTK
jgi:hypothetical protein